MSVWTLALLAIGSEAPDAVEFDLWRFPGQETAAAFADLGYHYKNHLEAARGVYSFKTRDVTTLLHQAEFCHDAWKHLRDAHANGGSYFGRRHHLDKLRDLLGDEDYYAGRMPPPTPAWPATMPGR